MEGIQIYELKRMDLRGATVIDGFPSVGLVSSIVANYLINALNLTQIGIMDSIYFPTVALVRDGQPMNPVRIYAGPKIDDRDQIVVFISEFQPPPNLIKAIAATVLDWAQDARCNLLVCPEGLIVDAKEDDGDRQVEVYGIGSTDKAMEMIRKNAITVFEEGVITGVAGVLLNEGRKRDFDVITLLSEAHPDYPDARAAARAIEVIDKLLLHTELDARPLYEEAERIEMQLKSIHHQTEVAKKPSEPPRPIASAPRYMRCSNLTSRKPWRRRTAACAIRFGMSSGRFETCAMPRTRRTGPGSDGSIGDQARVGCTTASAMPPPRG